MSGALSKISLKGLFQDNYIMALPVWQVETHARGTGLLANNS